MKATDNVRHGNKEIVITEFYVDDVDIRFINYVNAIYKKEMFRNVLFLFFMMLISHAKSKLMKPEFWIVYCQ